MMAKINKFYFLTLVIGIIFLNFDYFERFIFLRFLGRGLIILSIILFFIIYSPRKNERNQHDRIKRY
jgi:hypothetical protein